MLNIPSIKPFTQVLYTSLFGKGIIDLWLLIHFTTGMITFLIIYQFKKTAKEKFLMTFIILLIAEVIEYYLAIKNIVPSEPNLNILLDLVFGMTGAFVVYKLYTFKN